MQVLIGILIASFVEWFIHRFLLHGLGKNKNSIWHFHWKHHKSVRVENGYDLLYFKYNQGYPKERLSLFLAFLLISPLFFYYPIVAATLTAYLFVYYFVHKKAHRDVRWARKWIPWHYDHHMGRNQDKNYLRKSKNCFLKKKIIFLSSDVSVEDELNSRIKKIEKNEVDIIVATQLISKGFNFPDLNCIVVVNSDNIFFGSDIRSTEKNYQLLHQLSGRAGRFEDNALVILQSYENNNKLVDALSNEDIFKFYKEELNFRKAAYLPPYSKLISFIISGNNKFTVERNSIMIKKLIPKNDYLKIYGPVSAPISKIKSNFRSRILIKYSTKIRPQKLLKETVEKMKNFKNIKVEIDVDPINFM